MKKIIFFAMVILSCGHLFAGGGGGGGTGYELVLRCFSADENNFLLLYYRPEQFTYQIGYNDIRFWGENCDNRNVNSRNGVSFQHNCTRLVTSPWDSKYNSHMNVAFQASIAKSGRGTVSIKSKDGLINFTFQTTRCQEPN